VVKIPDLYWNFDIFIIFSDMYVFTVWMATLPFPVIDHHRNNFLVLEFAMIDSPRFAVGKKTHASFFLN